MSEQNADSAPYWERTEKLLAETRQAARDAAQEAVKGYGVGVVKAADAASAVWEALLFPAQIDSSGGEP